MIIRLDDNTWYKNGCSISYWYCFERFENSQGVIRSPISRKDKQYNCQTKNDKRKRNMCLARRSPLQTRVDSGVREGQAIHNCNVIFMYYSNITLRYKLYCSICSSWKLRCYCFNVCHYFSGYSKVWYHCFYHLFSIFFWTANISKNDKRGHFNNEDDVNYLFSIETGSAAPLDVALETQIVNPLLRGHIWDKEEVTYKTGDLLKEA